MRVSAGTGKMPCRAEWETGALWSEDVRPTRWRDACQHGKRPCPYWRLACSGGGQLEWRRSSPQQPKVPATCCLYGGGPRRLVCRSTWVAMSSPGLGVRKCSEVHARSGKVCPSIWWLPRAPRYFASALAAHGRLVSLPEVRLGSVFSVWGCRHRAWSLCWARPSPVGPVYCPMPANSTPDVGGNCIYPAVGQNVVVVATCLWGVSRQPACLEAASLRCRTKRKPLVQCAQTD